MSTEAKAAEIRVNDQFEIKVRVADFNDTQCKIELDMYQFWVAKAAILAGRRISRPLAVGDRVKFNDRSCAVWCGELRAIDEGQGWVRQISPKLGNCTVRLADLELAPASEGGGT